MERLRQSIGRAVLRATCATALLTGVAIAQAPRPANTLVTAAVDSAKKAHQNVLVVFGASWCGWCHAFDRFLDDPVAGRIMHDHFVVLHLTVEEVPENKVLENPGGAENMRAMGGTGGLPYFYILDGSGTKLGDANIVGAGHENVGHPNTAEEVDAFDKLLLRTTPRMTAAQRRTIFDYLTRVSTR